MHASLLLPLRILFLVNILVLCCAAFATKNIVVSIAQQSLTLLHNNQVLKTYTISTSGTGIGDVPDSNCTPLGKHRIHAKIGSQEPLGMIFKGGVATGRSAKIYTTHVPKSLQEDLITTRVMQLQGLEEQNKHSYSRGIWIHGTPYEGDIGTPCSHGCVRMRNKDIVELFELVDNNTIVNIVL